MSLRHDLARSGAAALSLVDTFERSYNLSSSLTRK